MFYCLPMYVLLYLFISLTPLQHYFRYLLAGHLPNHRSWGILVQDSNPQLVKPLQRSG